MWLDIFNIQVPDITKHYQTLSHISLSQGVGRASDRARRASLRSRGRQSLLAPRRGADGNAAAAPLCGGALEAVPRRLGTLRICFFFFKDFSDFLGASFFFK